MIEVARATTASPEDVWAVLADGWYYSTWVVGASRIRDVEAAWPAVGSRIHHSVGVWPLLINDSTQVLEAAPPHRLVLQARGWPLGEARVELETTVTGTGCIITIREDATHGPGRLAPWPVRVAMIKPRNVEALKRLAYVAEGRRSR